MKTYIGIILGILSPFIFDFLLKQANRKMTRLWHGFKIKLYDRNLEKTTFERNHQIVSYFHVLEDYVNSAERIILNPPGNKIFHIFSENIDFKQQIIDNTDWNKMCIKYLNSKECTVCRECKNFKEEYFEKQVFPDTAASAIAIDVKEFEKKLKISKGRIENIFLDKVKEGKPFFNGEMYGIHKLTLHDDSLVINSFITDYYTHRVMADIYKKTAESHPEIIPKVLDNGKSFDISTRLIELNKYNYYLTSMGMNILIYLEDENLILILKRSTQLLNTDKERWHMSVNEAISITDLEDGGGKKISLYKCVFRGIKEELGLSVNLSNPQIVFGDVFMVKKPIEIGITAFVKLSGFSLDMVRISYSAAKDGDFETTALKGIICTHHEIRKFLDNAKRCDEITPAGEYLLRMFLARGNKEVFNK